MNLPDEQMRTLAALLDEVIPPSADGRMPGAGALGLAERIVRDVAARPGSIDGVRSGLDTLDRTARGEHGEAFASLSLDARKQVVEQVSGADPFLLPSLAFPTYIAYYEHPQVLAALGMEPRPPHPKGYELEPFDESLLEGVRSRTRLYREC